jgi:hypothetical protein
VVQLGENLRFRNEQLNEALIFAEMWQDAFDRNWLFKTTAGNCSAPKDFGHSADSDSFEKLVPRHLGCRIAQ